MKQQQHTTNKRSKVTARAVTRRSVGNISHIDRHIGARVRERRIVMRLTQQQLANLIGVVYQQLAKYERAVNRISAGCLFEIAQALSVEVGYFFDGLAEPDGQLGPRERMCLDLARDFAQISNERHKEALSQLARVLASANPDRA